jgi:nucleotide-sensitive chloride channel 1A
MPENSSQAVILQVNLHDPETINSDDEISTLDLVLVPAASSSEEEPSPVKALFDSLSACADLHPDPEEPGDEDGEPIEEDTIPGAGGWITAENMADYMDEDGNFTGFPSGLGPGAGTIRTREHENGDEESNEPNGDDSKWQRTE